VPLYVLRIGNAEYTATRVGLKKWLALEDKKSDIFQATEDKDTFTDAILAYLSVAFDVPTQELEEVPWYEIIDEYATSNVLNNINFQFPLLNEPSSKEKAIWDYAGRTWYLWANLLAKSYGWTLKYISELDPDDGIALLQEILTDDQLDKEWEWGMSEIAYPYNETTKKSEFKELSRPVWMQKKVRKLPTKVKINVSMLPVGIITYPPTEVMNAAPKPS